MKRWFLLLVLLSGCQQMAGGGGQGTDVGGAIERPADAVAWFRGADRVIHACLDMEDARWAPVVVKKIERAFSTWVQYFDDKRVDVELLPAQRRSRKLELRKQCRGDEDLVFYVGRRSKAVNEARQRWNEPYGLSIGKSDGQGWSRGWVWIDTVSPFPGETVLDLRHSVVDVALLHEWGHVFGFEHANGTIMDPELIRRFQPDTEANGLLFHIDLGRELAVLPDGHYQSAELTADQMVSLRDWLFPEAPSDASTRLELQRCGKDRWFDLTLVASESRWSIRLEEEAVETSVRQLDNRTAYHRYRAKSDRTTVTLHVWEGAEIFGERFPVRIEIETATETLPPIGMSFAGQR